MTAKELAIIELLMSHPHGSPDQRAVDVYIGKLRKKIDGEFDNSLIETVRGLGYRLHIESQTDESC